MKGLNYLVRCNLPFLQGVFTWVSHGIIYTYLASNTEPHQIPKSHSLFDYVAFISVGIH